MEKKKSLFEEMKKFQGEKQYYIVALIMAGILGLIFPIIPGLLLIGMGIALLSPKHGDAFLTKIKNGFHWISAKFRF